MDLGQITLPYTPFIIRLLNHCAENKNANITEYTLAVLCDLSKAFDVINHDIFKKKLMSMELEELLINGSQVTCVMEVNLLTWTVTHLPLNPSHVVFHKIPFLDLYST